MKSKKHIQYTGIPFYIIWIGKVLQFFSVKWVTKYALKLFRTPIRFKAPKREEPMYFGSKKEMVKITEINKKVMVYRYGNAKRKVLLVHGWSGRGTQMSAIANKLIHNKYMVISFDAPAHGKSTGKTTHMNEFISTVKVLNEKFGPFEIAIGHSLGAMTVLNSIKEGLKVQKAVIIGSGDVVNDIIKNFVKQLQLKPVVSVKLKQILDAHFKGDVDTKSASVAAKSVLTPTLVIHDTEDRDVDLSCGKNIHKQLKNSDLIITNGLGHRRILRDKKVVEDIFDFVNSNKY